MTEQGNGSRGEPEDAASPASPEARDEAEGSAPGGSTTATETATPLTQQIGRVVLLLLLVLFGVFAATNAQPVDFSWVFGGTEVSTAPDGTAEGGVPLIVLLVLSFVLGGVVGGGAIWQGTRTRRRDRAERGDAAPRAR